MTKFILLMSALFFKADVSAQILSVQEIKNPPVVVEMLFGNEGFASQMTINKSFRSIPQLGIFSVTNMLSKWDEPISKDIMNQIHLTYEFVKGFKLFAGTHYTPNTGLRPNTAVNYIYSSKTFLLSIMPRIDLSKNSTIEGFAIVEYKLAINENWSFYSRMQGIYAETVSNGKHARSYLMLRAGLSYKDFRFGLAANRDAYGPLKLSIENYGIFIATNVFN